MAEQQQPAPTSNSPYDKLGNYAADVFGPMGRTAADAFRPQAPPDAQMGIRFPQPFELGGMSGDRPVQGYGPPQPGQDMSAWYERSVGPQQLFGPTGQTPGLGPVPADPYAEMQAISHQKALAAAMAGGGQQPGPAQPAPGPYGALQAQPQPSMRMNARPIYRAAVRGGPEEGAQEGGSQLAQQLAGVGTGR